MGKKCFPLLMAPFLLILAAATPQYSQNRSSHPADTDHARHRLAINLLRAINTEEVTYKMKRRVYASKDALLASEEFTQRSMSTAVKNDPQLANTHFSNGSELLPVWKLRLNLTPDGQGDDILLEDTTDTSCGYAALTDEGGIIRQAKRSIAKSSSLPLAIQ